MSKQGWRVIGGNKIYFRSTWEANYSRYLEWLYDHDEIINWFHEPKTFWFLNIKRGVRSYLPDFQVIRNDGTVYWVEVKGYMDAKSKTKIKRFKKYYPDEELLIVDGKWFAHNNAKMRLIIKDWEKGDAPQNGFLQKGRFIKYKNRDGGRKTTKTSCSDCAINCA